MPSRGQLVVFTIFALAIAGGCATVWWHSYRGHKAKQLWGVQAAVLVRHAPGVELLRLEGHTSAPSAGEVLTIDGRQFTIVERRDISQARGLVHVRFALIDDQSFDWQEPRGDCQPEWLYIFSFSRGSDRASVAIDFHCKRARLLGTEKELSVAPLIKVLHAFTDEQFPEQ